MQQKIPERLFKISVLFFERLKQHRYKLQSLRDTNADFKISLQARVYIKKYPENFAFAILEILELYTREVCEMFVYKHTETIQYVKNQPIFKEKYRLYG